MQTTLTAKQQAILARAREFASAEHIAIYGSATPLEGNMRGLTEPGLVASLAEMAELEQAGLLVRSVASGQSVSIGQRRHKGKAIIGETVKLHRNTRLLWTLPA